MSIAKSMFAVVASFSKFSFLFLVVYLSQSIFSSFAKAVPGPMSVPKAKESYIRLSGLTKS